MSRVGPRTICVVSPWSLGRAPICTRARLSQPAPESRKFGLIGGIFLTLSLGLVSSREPQCFFTGAFTESPSICLDAYLCTNSSRIEGAHTVDRSCNEVTERWQDRALKWLALVVANWLCKQGGCHGIERGSREHSPRMI